MAVMIASAAAAAITGIAGAVSSSKASKRADKQAKRAEARARDIERGRQKITNPYENVSNLSAMAKDLSGMASNPYSNLSVATGAAEMQAEETDIALANTLDTLRATGSSAGGATALAQAALQSKKGISASIEQQEVNNEKLRAEGEQQLEMIKMSEAQRIQSVQMSEAARMQNAEVMGKSYMFETKEARDARDLARYSAKEQNALAERNAYKSAQMGAITGAIGSVASIAGQAASSGAWTKSANSTGKFTYGGK